MCITNYNQHNYHGRSNLNLHSNIYNIYIYRYINIYINILYNRRTHSDRYTNLRAVYHNILCNLNINHCTNTNCDLIYYANNHIDINTFNFI